MYQIWAFMECIWNNVSNEKGNNFKKWKLDAEFMHEQEKEYKEI